MYVTRYKQRYVLFAWLAKTQEKIRDVTSPGKTKERRKCVEVKLLNTWIECDTWLQGLRRQCDGEGEECVQVRGEKVFVKKERERVS